MGERKEQLGAFDSDFTIILGNGDNELHWFRP